MAATVEGAFILIDKASGPMRKMEEQARRTDNAIASLGDRMDNVGTSKQIKQYESVGKQLRDVERQGKETEKGMKSLEQRTDQFEQTARRASRTGGLFRTSMLLMGAALAALLPVIVDVGGALGALIGSLGAATLGVGALGTALGGSLLVGLAGVAGAGLAAKDQIKSLKDEFKDLSSTWKDATRPGQRDFIGMLGDSIERAKKMIPELAQVTNRSTGITRDALSRFFDRLDTRTFDRFLDRMTDVYRDIAGPLVDSIANVGQTLAQIAIAAAPFVDDLVKGIRDWTAGWVDATKNTGKMRQNIAGWIDQARSWKNLLGATWDLTLSVFGSGKEEGQGLVDDMTKKVRTWNTWVLGNKDQMNGFWKDSIEGTKELAKFLGSLRFPLKNLNDAMEPLVFVFEKLSTALNSIKLPGTEISGLTAVVGGLIGQKMYSKTVGPMLGATPLMPMWVKVVDPLRNMAGGITGWGNSAGGGMYSPGGGGGGSGGSKPKKPPLRSRIGGWVKGAGMFGVGLNALSAASEVGSGDYGGAAWTAGGTAAGAGIGALLGSVIPGAGTAAGAWAGGAIGGMLGPTIGGALFGGGDDSDDSAPKLSPGQRASRMFNDSIGRSQLRSETAWKRARSMEDRAAKLGDRLARVRRSQGKASAAAARAEDDYNRAVEESNKATEAAKNANKLTGPVAAAQARLDRATVGNAKLAIGNLRTKRNSVEDWLADNPNAGFRQTNQQMNRLDQLNRAIGKQQSIIDRTIRRAGVQMGEGVAKGLSKITGIRMLLRQGKLNDPSGGASPITPQQARLLRQGIASGNWSNREVNASRRVLGDRWVQNNTRTETAMNADGSMSPPMQIPFSGKDGTAAFNADDLQNSVAPKVRNALNGIAENSSKINKSIKNETADQWGKTRKSMVNQMQAAYPDLQRAMRQIRTMTLGELKSLGYSPSEATAMMDFSSSPGAAAGGGGGNRGGGGGGGQRGATGMRIGGTGNQDSVRFGNNYAAPGELVVNQHTERAVNRDLMHAGKPPLGARVRGENRPHYMAAPARERHFDTGGRIIPAAGFPGESWNSSIAGPASRFISKYHLFLTDAYGSGHESPEHTQYGTAIDVVPGPGGSWNSVAQAAYAAVRMGWTPVGYDGTHGTEAWPGHGPPSMAGSNAHAHITVLGASEQGQMPGGIGRMTAGPAQSIRVKAPRTRLKGTPGAFAQRGAVIYAAGMEKGVNKKLGGGAITAANLAGFGAINHIYKEHNSANGDWGGEKLPFNTIAALAEAAGKASGVDVPGVTMAQMTIGESNRRPGATGIDPGGTKGLGLWMITTGYNDELIARFGGEAQMRNPVKNALAMAQILKTSGQGAWYGDSSVTDRNAHFRGGRATGGRLDFGGWFGRGGRFHVERPTLIGVGESGGETVSVTPKGKTFKGSGSAGGGVSVSIGKILVENHRKGDIKKMVKEEVGEALDELAAEMAEA